MPGARVEEGRGGAVRHRGGKRRGWRKCRGWRPSGEIEQKDKWGVAVIGDNIKIGA